MNKNELILNRAWLIWTISITEIIELQISNIRISDNMFPVDTNIKYAGKDSESDVRFTTNKCVCVCVWGAGVDNTQQTQKEKNK